MKRIFYAVISIFSYSFLYCQQFSRSELPTLLSTPWEIVYGPDNYLWLTEAGGRVVRVDPTSGSKQAVYTAADYFDGGSSEQSPFCTHPKIGSGTLGMALDPDFLNSAHAYIYYVYSYNSGTASVPVTKFKIERLKWDAATLSVTEHITLVPAMPTGYDHLGGRLMIIPQQDIHYLFFTVGDQGISETNSPDCYSPQSSNPNNFAQDPDYKNGKVHRFHLDGSIPSDNPIPGNSFYTRGHRNPQGLMFNPDKKIIYDIEHGDRSDDEVNILEAGMNYGWKYVRGFHADNNYPGEQNFVANYTPHPSIPGDALKQPLLTWCSTPQTSNPAYLDWCTVAPSDGLYYNKTGIPEWKNSLLITTLKNGANTDQEVYVFQLSADGRSLAVPKAPRSNPEKFFGADQALNGRLRDIAVSPDGTKIYLINNGGNTPDKITVYSYILSSTDCSISIYPNPASDLLNITCASHLESIRLYNLFGDEILRLPAGVETIDVSLLPAGLFALALQTKEGEIHYRMFIRLN